MLSLSSKIINDYSQWNKVLHKAEKELVDLLLIESSKIVEKTERDVEEEIMIPKG